MNNEKFLDDKMYSAEAHANVARSGVDKQGNQLYYATDLKYLETHHIKIKAFLAGVDWALQYLATEGLKAIQTWSIYRKSEGPENAEAECVTGPDTTEIQVVDPAPLLAKIAKLEDDLLSATKVFLNTNGKNQKRMRELESENQTLRTRFGIVKKEAASMASRGSTPKDRTYFKHIYNLCSKSLR